MFVVIDNQKSDMFSPIKSGFKTSSQANAWCKKNLQPGTYRLWGKKGNNHFRYYVMMK